MFWLPGAILSEKFCLGLFPLFQPWLGRSVDLARLLKPHPGERVQGEKELNPKWSHAGMLEAALLWLCASWLSCNTSALPPALAPLPNPHHPHCPRHCLPCSKETKLKTFQTPVKAWPLRKKKVPSKLVITHNSSISLCTFLQSDFRF